MSIQHEVSPYIRPLTIQDLNEITLVHCLAFPDSALTKLGHEAVCRYYEWQMIGPHDPVNIGVFSQDKLLGFCFSGVFRGALGGFLEKNRAFLIRQVVIHPWLLINPLFRERAQIASRRVFKHLPSQRNLTSLIVSVSKPFPSFGILSIAVDPQYQGSGVAKLLMEYSEEKAYKNGFARMVLTVHPSNQRAVRFYEKMGWQKDKIDGNWTGHMSKVIESRHIRLD